MARGVFQFFPRKNYNTSILELQWLVYNLCFRKRFQKVEFQNNQAFANLNPVSSVGAHDQVVRDARRLEVPGHAQREGVAADLGG